MSLGTKLILTDCIVTVNGVDLSDHCASVEVSTSKDAVDTTHFGTTGGWEQAQGLEKDKFTLELQQDFSPAEVDYTLWPLYEAGTEFTVTVQPVPGAASATNPIYSGTCILLAYTPLTGKPGQLSTTKVEFPVQRNTFTRTI